MRYILIFQLLLVLLAHHAMAQNRSASLPPASFDCNKAFGLDEQIICGDPALRQQDMALLAIYKKALAINPAHDQALRRNEHDWINSRNKICGVQEDSHLFFNSWGGISLFYVDCFIRQYAGRAADLRKIATDPAADPNVVSSPQNWQLWDQFQEAVKEPIDQVGVSVQAFLPFSLEPGDYIRYNQIAWLRNGNLLISATDWNKGTIGQYLWKDGRLSTLNIFPKGSGFIDQCMLPDSSTYYVAESYKSRAYGYVDADGHFSTTMPPGMDPSRNPFDPWHFAPCTGHWKQDTLNGPDGPVQTKIGEIYSLNGLYLITDDGPKLIIEGATYLQLSRDGCSLVGYIPGFGEKVKAVIDKRLIMLVSGTIIIVDVCHLC